MPHLSEVQLQAWRGLLEVQSRLLLLLDEDLQRHADLTINEFDVLYQLWTTPARRLRMKDLAQAVLVTPGGLTRLVARLEGARLVRRTRREGRQAVEAVLTPEGEERLREAMAVHFAAVRELFVDHLSATDTARLSALWRRLRRSLPRGGEG